MNKEDEAWKSMLHAIFKVRAYRFSVRSSADVTLVLCRERKKRELLSNSNSQSTLEGYLQRSSFTLDHKCKVTVGTFASDSATKEDQGIRIASRLSPLSKSDFNSAPSEIPACATHNKR